MLKTKRFFWGGWIYLMHIINFWYMHITVRMWHYFGNKLFIFIHFFCWKLWKYFNRQQKTQDRNPKGHWNSESCILIFPFFLKLLVAYMLHKWYFQHYLCRTTYLLLQIFTSRKKLSSNHCYIQAVQQSFHYF